MKMESTAQSNTTPGSYCHESVDAQLWRKCLVVVNAVKHFDVYLIGRKFPVVTDHRALSYLQSMQNANGRLTCWALVLQPFDFQVQH